MNGPKAKSPLTHTQNTIYYNFTRLRRSHMFSSKFEVLVLPCLCYHPLGVLLPPGCVITPWVYLQWPHLRMRRNCYHDHFAHWAWGKDRVLVFGMLCMKCIYIMQLCMCMYIFMHSGTFRIKMATWIGTVSIWFIPIVLYIYIDDSVKVLLVRVRRGTVFIYEYIIYIYHQIYYICINAVGIATSILQKLASIM